jgi:cyclophilin family peptidyl-prolyl cis-trans isomerase
MEELHPDDVRVVYRHFPLMSIHDKASLAGQAAEAAGAQGAFWEMHDYFFAHYDEWNMLSLDDFLGWLEGAADSIGLDVDAFMADIENGKYEEKMSDAFNAALREGLTGTPTIFLNGYLFQLAPEAPILEAAINLFLIEDLKYTQYPETLLEPGVDYLARIKLNIGEIVIQLYPDSAPLAVNSFLFLVSEGWFEGNYIHRVIPNLLVETGDPSRTGFGDPGYFYDVESDPALTFDTPGMVAITSSGPGTNGSRFFITLTEMPDQNGNHTIFGRVIEGLDLLMNLNERDPLDDILKAPEAIIQTITVEER